MSLKDIYLGSVEANKKNIRARIEHTAEETFEDERRKAYVEGALELGEEIDSLIPDAKEKLRLQCMKDLVLKKNSIHALWETMINVTAQFKTDYMVLELILTSVVLILLLFRLYPYLLVVAPVLTIISAISIFPGIFNRFMFLVTGLGKISDELFYTYRSYGRIEAALVFADYRKVTFIDESRKHWVYTSSHKKAPA